MNSHDVLRTAIKIGGLVLLVNTAVRVSSTAPLFFDQMKSSGVDFPVASIIATFFVPMLFGLVLWLFPTPVANTIIKNDLPPKSEEKFFVGIENVAIRVLGLYLLYHGTTDFVSQYASYHQATEMFGKNVNFSGKERFTIGFIVTGAEIVLALALMLGAAGITNMFRKARSAS